MAIYKNCYSLKENIMSIFEVFFASSEPKFPMGMSCYAWLDIFVVPAILLFVSVVLFFVYKKYRLAHAVVFCFALINLWMYYWDGCGSSIKELFLKWQYRIGFWILPLGILLLYTIPFCIKYSPKLQQPVRWILMTILIIELIILSSNLLISILFHL